MTPTTDPLTFVRRALDALPSSPSEVSAEDFAQLTAIGEGLKAHTAEVAAAMRGVSRRNLDGEATSGDRSEAEWLVALAGRCERASDELGAYLNAATKAHGLAGSAGN